MNSKIATREHIVTDQGNGGANCSECGHDLTSRFPYTEAVPNPCPGCGLEWVEGGMYVSGGGSD